MRSIRPLFILMLITGLLAPGAAGAASPAPETAVTATPGASNGDMPLEDLGPGPAWTPYDPGAATDATEDTGTSARSGPSGAFRLATVELDAACADAPRGSFADIAADDEHALAADCLAWWRVAGGFPDGTYGPSQPVTRGQMARFVSGAILASAGTLPAPGSRFADASTTVHQRSIERLAAADVVGGFPDGTYRASAPVTRGQMVTFLANALDRLEVAAPRLADEPSFSDTDGTTHAGAVERAAALGIAGGFPDGTFRPGDPVTRGQMASFLARTLEVVVRDGREVRTAARNVDRVQLGAEICRFGSNDVARADLLLDGRLTLPPHAEATLPQNPTWAENPFRDRNWRFQYHAMRWVWSLFGATQTSGDARYAERGFALLQSWVAANPFDAPASDFSWNDHSAAWRSLVLGCAALQQPPAAWLTATMVDHRDRLADPGFYVDTGNHALNQDAGLLTLACLTEDWDLRDLASERLSDLALRSIDAQGVTDEQAPEYQDYNYERYLAALEIHEACGLPSPVWEKRLELMPTVLAHMTQPDATYVPIGDTDRRPMKASFDTPPTRWFATQGNEGAPPRQTFVTYDAGFTFARSGFGIPGAFADEHFLSLRHGPARALHGHLDHGSLTLFADGEPLIVDPGKYAYTSRPERGHVVSAEAHNLVTVGEGCGPQPGRESPTALRASTDTFDRIAVRVGVCDGAGWTRVVAFVRDTGEVVVVDETRGPSTAAVTQRWQLDIGASAEPVGPRRVFATFDNGATLLIDQLDPVGATSIVTGRATPPRGFVSPAYNQILPAPNVEVTAGGSGTSRRFITVLRPGAAADAPVSTVRTTSDSITVSLPRSDGDAVEVRLSRLAP